MLWRPKVFKFINFISERRIHILTHNVPTRTFFLIIFIFILFDVSENVREIFNRLFVLVLVRSSKLCVT